MPRGRRLALRRLSGLLGAWIVLDLSLAWTSPRFRRTTRRVAARPSSSRLPAVTPPSAPRLEAAATAFVARVQASLAGAAAAGDFVALTLVGRSKRDVKAHLAREPSPPPAGSDSLAPQPLPPNLRGSLRLVEARLVRLDASKADAAAPPPPQLQVTFRYHLATDVVKNWPLETVPGRLRALLLADRMDQEMQQHVPVTSSEWNLGEAASSSSSPAPPLGSPWGIQYAQLETRRCTHRQEFTKALRSLETKSSGRPNKAQQPRSLEHDRARQGPLADSISPTPPAAVMGAPRNQTFWQALGLMTTDNQLKPDKASKFRQCVKFVEIVHHLIQQQLAPPSDASAAATRLNILDMGCGRGYLTFALHEHLVRHGAGGGGAAAPPADAAEATMTDRGRLQVRTKGIDIRPKLVQECNQVARSLGADFDGLMFETGSIQDIFLQGETDQHRRGSLFDWKETQMIQQGDTLLPRDVNILIALHACDTATDDALWAGISNDADVIVVAPCCHKQVRPQLDRLARSLRGSDDHPLRDVVRHPIYRERLAETATDALRALLLERAGYAAVQVFEFIGGEHTAKNSMITAVRQPQRRRGRRDADAVRERLHRLASFHGIRQHRLAELMGESLLTGADVGDDDDNMELKHPPFRGMPPL